MLNYIDYYIQGVTSIPLPPSDAQLDQLYGHKEKIALMEATVARWSRLVKTALKTEAGGLSDISLNPDPLQEIELWSHKAMDLSYIHNQLRQERAKPIIRCLETAKSPAVSVYLRLVKDVAAGKLEAVTVCRHLAPLKYYLSTMKNDFSSVTSTYNSLLQIMSIIWRSCRPCATPLRFTALFRQICNYLISLVRT